MDEDFPLNFSSVCVSLSSHSSLPLRVSPRIALGSLLTLRRPESACYSYRVIDVQTSSCTSTVKETGHRGAIP
jgi:hypothetical protein